jgi:hypothetical protein
VGLARVAENVRNLANQVQLAGLEVAQASSAKLHAMDVATAEKEYRLARLAEEGPKSLEPGYYWFGYGGTFVQDPSSTYYFGATPAAISAAFAQADETYWSGETLAEDFPRAGTGLADMVWTQPASVDRPRAIHHNASLRRRYRPMAIVPERLGTSE